MNPYKARKMAKVIALVIVVAMVATSLSVIFMVPSMFGSNYGVVYAGEEKELTQTEIDVEYKRLEEYMKTIKKHYKDTVTLEMLLDGAFGGTSDSLNDPYSVFYRNFEDKNQFINAVEGEFSGVGAVLESFDGTTKIDNVIQGSPAEKIGMKSGDVIKSVAGLSTDKMLLGDVVNLLKGELGTQVDIVVERDGKQLNFKLTREMIKVPSVYHEVIDSKIGYIQITSFDNDTAEEFAAARQALLNKNVKAFVLDIRGNLGGYIDSMANTLNLILPKGVMFHYETQGKIVESVESTGATKLYPTVVLVDEYTASASEIMAISLKDHKAATLVGVQTYGKGVGQQLFNLGDDKYAKLSVAYILSPNKTKYDGVGVAPDYIVENYSLEDKKKLQEVYALFAPMSEKSKPSEGATGLNVFGAQQRLSLLGYKVGVTGTMDKATVAAVKEFQRQNKLSPYGVLDYTTMRILDQRSVNLIEGIYDEDLQLKKGLELLKAQLK